LATTLLEALKSGIALLELEPSGGGVFDVSVDGEMIYSKHETGEFPAAAAILAEVQGRVA
jgi:selenoprotein W-related protein